MYISPTVRTEVFSRAFQLCEYCLLHESDLHLPLQIEHIISQKHIVSNELSNLASACLLCNRYKGSDLSTVLPPDLSVIRLYRPRTDIWIEHFDFSEGLIVPKTKIGEATVKVLRLNSENRVNDRLVLEENGFFPHPNVEVYWESQLSR